MTLAETVPWSDPEAAQRRVIARICKLPRKGERRDFRDLTLLAAVTTAGPLALFALGIGANPPIAASLGAVAIAAMGTSIRLSRRALPPDVDLASDQKVTKSQWSRASFGLIKGRHKATTESRAAKVMAGAGAGGSTQGPRRMGR